MSAENTTVGRVSKRNPHKRAYRKHVTYFSMDDDMPNYELFKGVMIFDGTSPIVKERYEREIALFNAKLLNNRIFAELEHSTTTADGQINGIAFDERVLIKELPAPNGNIVRIGCNFGELYNPLIKVAEAKKKSTKGRKPKPVDEKKIKASKRKVQGTGAYFNTQITFNVLPANDELISKNIMARRNETKEMIERNFGSFREYRNIIDESNKIIEEMIKDDGLNNKPANDVNKNDLINDVNESNNNNSTNDKSNNNNSMNDESNRTQIIPAHSTYDVKLFRNGKFQMSGVQDATMHEIVPILHEVADFLNVSLNRADDCKIRPYSIRSVMRNYKTHLTDAAKRVKLRELERVINYEKKSTEHFDSINNFITENFNKNTARRLFPYIARQHPMGIAEVRYNNDKIMSLIIKLYRPIPDDMEKKHTINVYVSGKVNFDGGNSELEVRHIYMWLEYIFQKYKNDVLINIEDVYQFIEDDDDHTDSELIFDDEIKFEDESSEVFTKVAR